MVRMAHDLRLQQSLDMQARMALEDACTPFDDDNSSDEDTDVSLEQLREEQFRENERTFYELLEELAEPYDKDKPAADISDLLSDPWAVLRR